MKAIKLEDGEYYAVINRRKNVIKTWVTPKYSNSKCGIITATTSPIYTPKELIGKKYMIQLIPYKRKQKKCQT